MENLVRELNENMKRVVEKVDEYGQKIAELSVKVDMYRENHNAVARKLETVEQNASEALASTKASHKRLDEVPSKKEVSALNERIIKLESVVNKVGWLIVSAVILAVLGLVIVNK